MRNRSGYNYLKVPDVAAEMRHARAANLGGGLFFQNNLDFARDFKTNLPGANVVLRNWPDREVPKDPEAWLKSAQSLGEGGLIVQTVNEVGFTEASLGFHEWLLNRIKRDKIKTKFGLLGTSVGTPDPDHDWPRADKILRMADELRDQIHLILHEYYGGVITSGFNGGDPTMIQESTWPKDTVGMTLWHVGRYRFLKRYCRLNGIPLPRIIIGEFGADFTGDIGKWLATLTSTKGQYDVVDGWRDLWIQWRRWWPTWDAATAFMKQLRYADERIYIDPEVESILLYCRWDDGNWGTYMTNPEVDKQMEEYGGISLPEPEQPPPPPEVESPWIVRELTTEVNIRMGAGTNNTIIKKLLPGEILALQNKPISATSYVWYPVKLLDGTIGYVALINGLSLDEQFKEPEVDNPPVPDGKITFKMEVDIRGNPEIIGLYEGLILSLMDTMDAVSSEHGGEVSYIVSDRKEI